MQIVIKRIRIKGEAIDGHLYIDGSKICDTAENAEYCLKPGTYPVVRHKCKQYARFVPAILSGSIETQESLSAFCEHCQKLDLVFSNTTLPCFCPQIKMGNGIHNRKDGSILVGKYICPGCLSHPKAPFENLCERMRKLNGRGSEITLTIEEHYPAPVVKDPPMTVFEMGTRVLSQMHTRHLCCE